MKYDLLLLADTKDYCKLELCLDKCLQHLIPQPVAIYVVTPTKIKLDVTTNISIKYYLDSDVINISKQDINYRRQGWIFKQLMLMFQNITNETYYLAVDSDVFFLQNIHLFDGHKPKFFISNNKQNHKPYFNLLESVYGIGKTYPESFICDLMMFNKDLCRKLFGTKIQSFYDAIKLELSENSLLGDYEWYGTLVYNKYPDRYSFENIKCKLTGEFGSYHANIDDLIETYKSEYDIVTAHTWI